MNQSQYQIDLGFMAQALNHARQSFKNNEVPVGAVIVREGEILGEAGNLSIANHDPCGHAEIRAIQAAGQTIKNYRLTESTLYVTLEPCSMCAGAILHARIKRVVFSVYDERTGAVGSRLNLLQSPFMNHRCELLSGILAKESADLLKKFFNDKRNR